MPDGKPVGKYNVWNKISALRRHQPLSAGMGGTLVLVTHGIEGGAGVGRGARGGHSARPAGSSEVRVGCIKGRPGLADALSGAPDPVRVVPLLMAEGFIHDLMRRRLAELPGRGGWRLAAPVGCHPGLPEADPGEGDGSLPAAGLGHTPDRAAPDRPRHAASPRQCRWPRATWRRGWPAPASPRSAAAFLEEPPLPAQAVAALPGKHVVAVGLFLDNGPHGDDDVREALAPVGRPVAYTGAIGADPVFVPLILDQAAAAPGLGQSAMRLAA